MERQGPRAAPITDTTTGSRPLPVAGSGPPSKLKGQTFPDFVHSLFKRIESGMKGFIVKVKYVAQHEKSEKPVVTFHVEQHLLNRVTYGDNRI
jgi:hypothetical protein